MKKVFSGLPVRKAVALLVFIIACGTPVAQAPQPAGFRRDLLDRYSPPMYDPAFNA